MNKKITFVVVIMLMTAFHGFSQGVDVGLARSSPNYMVTPGDVYTLTFSAAGNIVVHTIVVGADYRIRVLNLGIVNGRGRTFAHVRNEIEAVVSNNHPLSGPQLIITQPAVFRVFVNGEVYAAGERSAWGLSRLSSLVGDLTRTDEHFIRDDHLTMDEHPTRTDEHLIRADEHLIRADEYLTRFASIRDITIRSTNGQTRVFDLFQFWRFGDQTQNPYLRPGDIITFNRINRRVIIQGEVERPGIYQMLAGENLRELIEIYGNNLTPLADLSRMTLTRFVGGEEISGDIILLSVEDITDNFALEHMDVILIPNIADFRPAVPIERRERTITIAGAVRRPGTFEMMLHENLQDLIEVYGDGFTPLADPTRIEIVRRLNSEDASGNRLFLSLSDLDGDFALEHYDMVIIPSVSDLLPVLFVEGAVGIDITAALVTTNRETMQFHHGETYASLVRRNRGWFSAVSDLENAYVVRYTGEIVPLNLNLALFDFTYRGEVLVENLDTLIIPFRQFFVTVAGAVMNPGRFPFIPERSWDYYVALAGGFTPGRNTRESITIRDVHGRRLGPGDPITPETVITARTNHPMFLLSQYVVPVLSIVTTLLTVFLLVR